MFLYIKTKLKIVITFFLTLVASAPNDVAYTTAHGIMYRNVQSATMAEVCAVCNRSVAEPSVLSKDPEAVDVKW